MNRKILTLVCLILAAAPGLAFSASVYKWTDENGVVHFGDRQPTGQPSERINVRTGTPSTGSVHGSDRTTPQEQLQALEKEREKETTSEQEKARQEALRKQRESICEKARANLETLNTYSRIRVEEDGEIRYLTPEEIEAQREKAQQLIEENCGPVTDTSASE